MSEPSIFHRRARGSLGPWSILATLVALVASHSVRADEPASCSSMTRAWLHACAASSGLQLEPIECRVGALVAVARSSRGQELRVEITRGGGFHHVDEIGFSPIGDFPDWDKADPFFHEALAALERCAAKDSSIGVGLAHLDSATPAERARHGMRASWWTRTEAAAPWLLLLPLSILALAWCGRASPREGFHAALAGVIALALRAMAPHLPANWYSDLLGPAGMDGATFLRREGGYAGFFQLLARVFPVDDQWLFAWPAIASSLAVALLCAAAQRAARRDGDPVARDAALAWGLLCAFDPRLVYLGASDAPHETALLAFALGLFALGEAFSIDDRDGASGADGKWSMASGWRVAAIAIALGSGALTGMTRPELAVSPLVWPLLLPPRQGSRRAWIGSIAVAVLSSALAGLAWWGRDLGAAMRPVDAAQVWRFISGHAPMGVVVRWVPLVVAAAWRGRPRLLLPIAAYALLVLPRLPTDFVMGMHKVWSPSVISAVRYDAIVEPVLLYGFALAAALVAHGGVGLARRPRQPDRFSLTLASIALTGVLVIPWFLVESGAGLRFERLPLPYQAEWVFLRDELARLPRNAVVATVWDDHFPDRVHDPDTGLGVPSALVAWRRPDLRWRVLSAEGPLPGDATHALLGAMCSLAPDPPMPDASDIEKASIARVLEQCRALRMRMTSTISERTIPVDREYWPLRDDRVDLVLGQLSPSEKGGR